MLARQQDDDTVRARLDAFVATATGIRNEGLAVVQMHPVEMTSGDARLIGAIAAYVRQLIVAEHRARHRHTRPTVPRATGIDAHVTVDAFT